MINPELLKVALWRIRNQKQAAEKQSFQPPMSGDPSGGGGAPPGMDPSGGGGAPPPGPPPGMAAGMDPAAAQMAGGGGDLQSMVTQAVQQAMAGAGGAGGGMGGKPMKADINTVAMDVFQIKKMLVFFFNSQNIPLPPDILDGPNRDPSTGAAMAPGAPGSTSDPARQAPAPGGDGGGGAIPPIQPMEAAQVGGGGEKTSMYIGEAFEPSTPSPAVRSAALATIISKMQKAR